MKNMQQVRSSNRN